MARWLFPVLATTLLLAAAGTACAQSDSIVANPKAVQLRRIWVQSGERESGANVGGGVASVGDVNGDKLDDFAVWSIIDDSTAGFRIYYGRSPAPSDTASWMFETAGVRPDLMVAGNFYGTGHKALAMPRDLCDSNGICLYRLFVHRTDAGMIDSNASTVVDTKIQFCPRAVIAADLDRDGADELVLVRACSFPEIWIYRGGELFSGDSATVKIGDTEESMSANFFASVADFDHDGALDLMSAGFYADGAKIKIYWGDGTLDGWRRAPRVITLSSTGHPRIGNGLTVLDCDGDGVADLCLSGPDGNTYLYRTRGTGKSARTRSFDLADADDHFAYAGIVSSPGYIADATRRFAALGIAGQPAWTYRVLSGSPQGPDHAYDASFTYNQEWAFSVVSPMGDCNGDGWDDFIAGNAAYGWLYQGIAAVYAGGPYIPADDTTAAVRQVELEGRAAGLSIWPNPVLDELNIAWRGDLASMPRRFSVHDVAGRLVARGEVPIGSGAALWRCGGEVPAGVYVLSVQGDDGALLASVRFVKRRNAAR